ncbi:MAG: metallophosphoesterase, partial [Candidatus Geothermincolia bacterium]
MRALCKSSRKAWAVALIVAIGSMIIVTGMPPQKAHAAYSDPPNYVIGLQTPAKITKLIYPTIGNPAIVKKGTTLEIEFDPREGHFTAPWATCPTCTDFQVIVSSTNGGQGQILRSLPVVSAVQGFSTKWPQMKEAPSPDKHIYIVTVTVPYSLPVDLYDLTVNCTIEGTAGFTDVQTNSLEVIDEFKTNFNFIQMSDIHVYGSENTDASFFYQHSRTERNDRRTTYDASPTGAGWGAKYLHKEIMEINRIHPDFCIFTGDYDFGQRYFSKNQGNGFGTNTQFEYEQSWFYQEIQALEVPVYIVIGNHDGYNYATSFGAPVEQDWCNAWTRLYAPVYFSYNYGPDNKFFSFNSMDWPSDQRALQNYLNIILQPVKYLGAVTTGGDTWAPGVSAERLNAINVENFNGQLGWLRDELAASQGAKIRVCAMHHDPWKENGSGSMWASGSEDFIGQITGALDMGDGPGRLALIKLATQYKVALMVHGHDHSDCTSEDDSNKALLDWIGGGGHVVSQNTTSGAFQGDGNSTEYPGYRRVWIDNGEVTMAGNESINYQEPFYSWPAYAGTNVAGTTNLGSLSTPAVQQTWTGQLAPNGEDATCSLSSVYAKPLNGMYAEFPMKMLDSGYYYTVSNGTLGQTFDVSGTVRMNQVNTNLNAYQTNKAVRVQKSATPDLTAPQGSISINDGAATTSNAAVTLALDATDTESGLQDMMVSNDAGFAGAEWEPLRASIPWTLDEGTSSGTRTVYVKYRDRAMPGNTAVKTDSIYYEYTPPSGPKIVSITPNISARPVGFFGATIVGQNTNFVQGTTHVTITKPNGSGITLNEIPPFGDTHVVDPTHITVNMAIEATATLGTWDVGVTIDGGPEVTPLHNGFTVDGPAVTEVAPASGSVGQTLDVVITGNGKGFGFVDGTSHAHFWRSGADVSGIDIRFNESNGTNLLVTDSTHATARITIAGSCDPGPVDVTVHTATDEAAPLEEGFQVISHTPRIISISPTAGVRSQTIDVDIVGVDTAFVQGTSVASFGSGITPNSTTVTNGTHATANITIAGNATFGTRNVNVTTGDEVPNALIAGFSVEQNSPVVQSIVPDEAFNSGPVTVDVNGANFQSGATVKLVKASQDDILPVVGSYNYSYLPNKIRCTFDLTDKFAGAWDVVVTNPDAKTGTLVAGFTIKWPAPTVTSIFEDHGDPGETVPVSIAGTNFRPGAQVKLTKSGQTDLSPTAEP